MMIGAILMSRRDFALVLSCALCLVSTKSFAYQLSSQPVFQAEKTPFTAEYSYSRKTSGFPKGMDPTDTSGDEALIAQATAPPDKDVHSLLTGEKKVIVSSNGHSLVYLCKVGDKTFGAVICNGEGVASYTGVTHQASIRQKYSVNIAVTAPIPPLPFSFPNIPPVIEGPRKRTRADDVFQVPTTGQLVRVLRPDMNIGAGKLPYYDGVYDRTRGRIFVGPSSTPAYEVSYSGYKTIGTTQFPVKVTEATHFFLLKEGKEIPASDVKEYQLTSIVSKALPDDAFLLESYLADGNFVENGARGVRYKAHAKSLSEQLGVARPAPAPVRNPAGIILAFLGVAGVGVGLAVVLRRKLPRRL